MPIAISYDEVETGSLTSVDEKAIPFTCQLFNPVAEPENGNYTFIFALPQKEKVEITLHRASGDIALSVVSRRIEAGIHQISRDLSNLEDGTYICIMSTGRYTAGIKMRKS